MSDQVSGLLSPWLRRKRFEILTPHLKGKVLDCGCGTGHLSRFCEKGYVGVEVDEESLDIARMRAPALHFAAKVPDEEIFDTIVLAAVIEHIKNPREFLKSLLKHLKLDGSILITTPSARFGWLHALGARIGLFSREALEEHERLFSMESMCELAREVKLQVVSYSRFLIGANQFFILKHSK